MMKLDQLPHLETFVKAAELSSFSAAARALDLTQAAVSQRIQALEGALNVALFRRQGGRVLLTEAGRCLYPYAERILLLHREARAEVTGRKELLASELSLAASSVPGEHLLPGLLSAFRQRHPHVQVRATVTDSRAVLEQVEQGEALLGLLGGKGECTHLLYCSLGYDALTLVVLQANLWARTR